MTHERVVHGLPRSPAPRQRSLSGVANCGSGPFFGSSIPSDLMLDRRMERRGLVIIGWDIKCPVGVPLITSGSIVCSSTPMAFCRCSIRVAPGIQRQSQRALFVPHQLGDDAGIDVQGLSLRVLKVCREGAPEAMEVHRVILAENPPSEGGELLAHVPGSFAVRTLWRQLRKEGRLRLLPACMASSRRLWTIGQTPSWTGITRLPACRLAFADLDGVAGLVNILSRQCTKLVEPCTGHQSKSHQVLNGGPIA